MVFTVWIKMLISCFRLFETTLNYNFISKQGLIWSKTPVKDLLKSPKNKLSLGLFHKENYVSLLLSPGSKSCFAWISLQRKNLCLILIWTLYLSLPPSQDIWHRKMELTIAQRFPVAISKLRSQRKTEMLTLGHHSLLTRTHPVLHPSQETTLAILL